MRTPIQTTLLLLALLLSSPAFADDTIVILDPVVAPVDAECPPLTQVKYPWLDCDIGPNGVVRITTATVAPIARWSTHRRIPLGYIEVEGVGHWGDHIDGDGID